MQGNIAGPRGDVKCAAWQVDETESCQDDGREAIGMQPTGQLPSQVQWRQFDSRYSPLSQEAGVDLF